MNSKKPKNNNHFFVLTGGPGVGKTSAIDYLKNKNMRCIKEAARSIIKKQIQNGTDALPWRNKNMYKNLMLDLSAKDYLEASSKDEETTFFDRGIPDILAYAYLEKLSVSKTLRFYSNNYRYNSTVFIFPPWKKIYKTDAERKQQFDEVVKTHEIMIKTYKECGYKLIIMPKASIKRRGEFILQCINK